MPSSYRSHEFDEYLRTQPLDRRKQLMAAEKDYAANIGPRIASAEEVFQESMCGLEEHPAGIHASAVMDDAYQAISHSGGDWSWRPYRYAKDPGRVFTDAEIDALYPGRVYRPNARLP